MRPEAGASLGTQAPEEVLLADGGVVANNPSSEAVAFTSIAYGQDNVPLELKVSMASGQALECACVRHALRAAPACMGLQHMLKCVLTILCRLSYGTVIMQMI